jgi:hypothetical protein
MRRKGNVGDVGLVSVSVLLFAYRIMQQSSTSYRVGVINLAGHDFSWQTRRELKSHAMGYKRSSGHKIMLHSQNRTPIDLHDVF